MNIGEIFARRGQHALALSGGSGRENGAAQASPFGGPGGASATAVSPHSSH